MSRLGCEYEHDDDGGRMSAEKRITVTLGGESQSHLAVCMAQKALDHDGTSITVSDIVREALERWAMACHEAKRAAKGRR